MFVRVIIVMILNGFIAASCPQGKHGSSKLCVRVAGLSIAMIKLLAALGILVGFAIDARLAKLCTAISRGLGEV